MKNSLSAIIYEAIRNGDIKANKRITSSEMETREYLHEIEKAQAITSSGLDASGIRFKG